MKQLIQAGNAFFAGICALACMCSAPPLAGGNSSQTGNAGITVASLAQSISGVTAPNARISIYEQDFKPYLTPSGYSDSVVADDSGRYSFSPAQNGYYNLIVYNDRNGGAGFVPHIPLFADSTFSDTVDTLRQPGFISGTAMDTTGNIFPLSYVFIDGSPFYTVTKNNGGFLLGPLPPGTYLTGFYANFQVANPATGSMVQMANVVTKATVVTVLPDSISQWNW